MAHPHRIHGPAGTAVLYLYDGRHEPPLPVELAQGGLVVVAPSTADDLAALKTFFIQAAAELGLKPLVTGD